MLSKNSIYFSAYTFSKSTCISAFSKSTYIREISINSQNLNTFFPPKYLHTFSKSIYFPKKSTYFLKIYILPQNICLTKNLYTFSKSIYCPLFQNEVEIINVYTLQKKSIYFLKRSTYFLKIYIRSKNLHTF